MRLSKPSSGAGLSAFLLLLLLIVGLSACGGDADTERDALPATADSAAGYDTTTLLSIVQSDDRFTTLATAIDSAGLAPTLQREGPLTVFAPTDEAFETLPAETLARLLQPAHQEQLAALLRHHIVEGRLTAADVTGADSVAMMDGGTLSVSTTNGALVVGEAAVSQADVAAGNGLLHVIDAVLMPEDMTASM